MDYCGRTQAALANPNFLDNENQRIRLLKVLREEEQQTLFQLYGSKSSSKARTKSSAFSLELRTFANNLTERRRGFLDNRSAIYASALQEVEQEREVAFEVEAVREVQKSKSFSPLTFPGVYHYIFEFVDTGKLIASSPAYEHVLKALRSTLLGQKYGIRCQDAHSKFFLSREFMRSVKIPVGASEDINFIVSYI